MEMETKERMMRLIAALGLSKAEFERVCGLSNGYVNSIRNSVGSKGVALILKKFPQVNKSWLVLGEGEMFSTETPDEPKPGAVMSYDTRQPGVPYYAVDFIGGFDFVFNNQQAVPDARIVFPQFSRAECWVDISGNSMEPLISSGDLIALRRVQDWQHNILYGEVYAIVTEQYRTVKRIRRSDVPDHIRLVPENPEYDPQDIATSAVVAVFAVLGCAKRLS